MINLSEAFKSKRKALIAYVTVGYPDVEATLAVVPLLARSGCDVIELGIPFSDPLADGITIQNASHRSLQNGITVQKCLEIARQVSKQVKTPLTFMTYYNPVLNFGLEAFCNSCYRAGVAGLIVPDLPPEEGGELESCTGKNNLDLIYLLAPNSTADRVRLVAERSRGFIYLVSLTGVTGARSSVSAELSDFVQRVRTVAQQPLCVGFGISTAEQAVRVAGLVDGVIIGSKIIQLMEANPSLKTVGEFVEGVRKALDLV